MTATEKRTKGESSSNMNLIGVAAVIIALSAGY